MSEFSIFGATGYIATELQKSCDSKFYPIPRESRLALSNDSIYFISTVDNYNVFEDIFKDVNVNLLILLETLKNLKAGQTINFISSWFVYGECDLPATESSVCDPKGFYSITKRTAEQLLISYCETFKINYRILRLCNVYGNVDQKASKKKNALHFLATKIKNNEEIGLYYNGQFYRDYMHVKDVAKAIELVCKSGELNTIYNVGSGEKILFKEVIDLIVKETESTSIIKEMNVPDFHRTIQVKNFYFNTVKLKKLGFKQAISLKEGIKSICH
tara:strand:- start:81127 stop:81945 length:819 start_codon:yes stop_codon:yes gene_type:complete